MHANFHGSGGARSADEIIRRFGSWIFGRALARAKRGRALNIEHFNGQVLPIAQFLFDAKF